MNDCMNPSLNNSVVMPSCVLPFLSSPDAYNQPSLTLGLILFYLLSVTLDDYDSSFLYDGMEEANCALVGTFMGLNFFSFSLFYAYPTKTYFIFELWVHYLNKV